MHWRVCNQVGITSHVFEMPIYRFGLVSQFVHLSLTKFVEVTDDGRLFFF